MKRRRLISAAAGCALLLAGCSSTAATTATGTATGGSSGTSAASTAPDTIVIQAFMFRPMSLTVQPGATVTVVNKDSATHTLTSAASPHAFDTGDIAPGASASFRAPVKPGAYGYICSIHQYMQGTLTVQ